MENRETIGAYLKRIRISKKLSLRDVSSQIHIKQSYLEAIEESDYRELRSEVYIRGFLRSYSRFLGVSSDFAIECYEKERKSPTVKEEKNTKREARLFRKGEKNGNSERKKESPKLFKWLLGIVVLLLVVGMGIWKGPEWIRIVSIGRHEIGNIRIETIAEENSWIQVWIDGQLAGEGFFPKNKQQEWIGREEIQIIAGDGSAILVKVNGEDRGHLSMKKEKVHQVFRSP